MTVVAYRDGIMAADSVGWVGDVKVCGTREKVFRLPDGSLFGCAGRTSLILKVRDWLSAWPSLPSPPATTKDDDGFEGVLVHWPAGTVYRIDGSDLAVYPVYMPFYCIGAHHEMVWGALAAGASAVEAVEIAVKYGQYAGGAVTWKVLRDG